MRVIPTPSELKAFKKDLLRLYYLPERGYNRRFFGQLFKTTTKSIGQLVEEIEKERAASNGQI